MNYTNIQKGVHETTEFFESFLRNLLLGENNELKNRNMHISCTLDETLVLNLLKENPTITQKQPAKKIKKSERTVKTITASLEERKYIERINGRRFGYWKVNV